MRLYFTRHGKTEWNQEMRFQGMRGDSPLLPTSYKEIELLGQAIKDIPFKKIFSSTSNRAKETAQGINKELLVPTEIVYTDDLRELGLGKLEGQLIREMRKKYSKELDHMRFQLNYYDPSAFDGEKIEDAIVRITSYIKKVTDKQEGPFLIVGHGASLTAAIQHLLGKPLAELRRMGGLKNNSLSIIEKTENDGNNHYTLELWNDDSFLNT